MIKLTAVIMGGLFAAGTMFAGDECEEQVQRCRASLASLNLEAGPQRMMNAVLRDYRTSNCSEAIEEKVMDVARSELTPEQYEKFKSGCKKTE